MQTGFTHTKILQWYYVKSFTQVIHLFKTPLLLRYEVDFTLILFTRAKIDNVTVNILSKMKVKLLLIAIMLFSIPSRLS